MRVFYEEWLPSRNSPAALVIDEIHRLMPKDREISENAQQAATYVAEAFKDWAERKLIIAAATQTFENFGDARRKRNHSTPGCRRNVGRDAAARVQVSTPHP